MATLIYGRAVIVPEPVYPPDAQTAGALGEVAVEVAIDTTGNVVSARAVSGHEALRKPAESAAMLSKFAPAYVSGRAMRIAGTIVYDFKSADSVQVSLRKMKVEPLSAEDKRTLLLGEKMHSWVYAVVERLQKNDSTATPNEPKFVRDGKAEIQVVLTAKTPESVAKLKALGLEIAAEKGTTLTGRIAIEKLAALAELDEVKLVIPKM